MPLAPETTCLVTSVREDLCLAYANTRWWRGREPAHESLTGFADLLGWLERSANVAGLGNLRTWARVRDCEAGAVFAEAVALREALFRLFSALAAETAPADRDIRAVRHAVQAAPARDQLVRRDGVFAWRVTMRPSAAGLLAPVLWSAGDLMVNAAQRRIRGCANPECRWLFIDASKGGTRRWCDMAACGNRAKARRHYARVRSQGT